MRNTVISSYSDNLYSSTQKFCFLHSARVWSSACIDACAVAGCSVYVKLSITSHQWKKASESTHEQQYRTHFTSRGCTRRRCALLFQWQYVLSLGSPSTDIGTLSLPYPHHYLPFCCRQIVQRSLLTLLMNHVHNHFYVQYLCMQLRARILRAIFFLTCNNLAVCHSLLIHSGSHHTELALKSHLLYISWYYLTILYP